MLSSGNIGTSSSESELHDKSHIPTLEILVKGGFKGVGEN